MPSPPDNTVKVAIVTVIGLVVATSITAIASTFRRENNHPTPGDGGVTRQFLAALERDRVDLGTLRVQYAHLREACFQRGLDPDNLIREQEEP